MRNTKNSILFSTVQIFGRYIQERFQLVTAAMGADRKIVIAVDDSEASAYAFTWALQNLVRKTDKVVVLTAAPFVTLDYPSTDIATGTSFSSPQGCQLSQWWCRLVQLSFDSPLFLLCPLESIFWYII